MSLSALLGLADIPEWIARAACAHADPADFYPPTGAGNRAATAAARAICAECPVKAPCLQHALDHREEFGTWGGVTADERYRMRRKS